MPWAKDQKHCKRGHRLSEPDAFYTFPDGRRQCRICRFLHNEQRKGRIVISDLFSKVPRTEEESW